MSSVVNDSNATSVVNSDIMTSIMNYNGIFLIIGIILAIIITVVLEYINHDCIPGKQCNAYVQPPMPGDSPTEYIDRVRNMAHQSYSIVIWRQALIAALIATPIVVYYFRQRCLTLWELILIGTVIFLGAYLSMSWLLAHFYRPNGEYIESALLELRDNL